MSPSGYTEVDATDIDSLPKNESQVGKRHFLVSFLQTFLMFALCNTEHYPSTFLHPLTKKIINVGIHNFLISSKISLEVAKAHPDPIFSLSCPTTMALKQWSKL